MNMHIKPAQRLLASSFAAAFGETLSDYVRGRVGASSFAYRPLSLHARDQMLRQIVEELTEHTPAASGTHRLPQWEKGWSENLTGSVIPKYFGKYPIVRFRREFIAPVEKRFEYDAFGIVKDWMFDKHLRDVDAIWEFGCGTGHNLIDAHRINPRAALCGLDWTRASQQLIARLNPQLGDMATARNFDFFHPDAALELPDNTGVFTAAALEQTGTRFSDFIDWLIQRRPAIVVHIEPIEELLDPDNLLDYLSIQYARKRNYLRGLLPYLEACERDGRIRILDARRSGVGSLFLDGYSVVAWRPA